MKILALAAVVGLAGCVTTQGPDTGPRGIEQPPENPAAKASARVAFESFRSALMARDGTAALGMMSVQMVSNWVFTRMVDKGDERFPKLVEQLESGARTDLEYWYRRNRNVPPDFGSARPEVLPETVLRSRWLADAWNVYYREDAEQQKLFAQAMEIAEVYTDGDGATVLVKISGAPSKMYGLVIENASWKLDHYVNNPTRPK